MTDVELVDTHCHLNFPPLSDDTDGVLVRATARGVTRVRNKVDLSGNAPRLDRDGDLVEIALSAKTGSGVDLLRDHLKQLVAYEGTGEGEFSARRRHLEALDRVGSALLAGREALLGDRAGELLAEDLRQESLDRLTAETISLAAVADTCRRRLARAGLPGTR